MSNVEIEFVPADELEFVSSHLVDITYDLEQVMNSLALLGKPEAHAYVLRSLVGLNKLKKLIWTELQIVREQENRNE